MTDATRISHARDAILTERQADELERMRRELTQAAPYQSMFQAAASSLAEISRALAIPDDVASTANGNDEILRAIKCLQSGVADLQQYHDWAEPQIRHYTEQRDEIERLAHDSLAHDPRASQPPADCEDRAPIAKLTVSHGLIRRAGLYAPGLPDGDHDVFPIPQPPAGELGWQPIETAPMDGRYALVYRPLAETTFDQVVDVKRLVGGNHHCWPCTVPSGQEPYNPTDGACHVTHWMPLPAPPAKREGQS